MGCRIEAVHAFGMHLSVLCVSQSARVDRVTSDSEL